MEKITINKQEAEIIKRIFGVLDDIAKDNNLPRSTNGEFENLKLKINKFLHQDEQK